MSSNVSYQKWLIVPEYILTEVLGQRSSLPAAYPSRTMSSNVSYQLWFVPEYILPEVIGQRSILSVVEH